MNSFHCWWEHKMLWPLWKAVWRFLTKLNRFFPYDLAIVILSIYTKELYRNLWIWMLIVASFTLSKLEGNHDIFSRWKDEEIGELSSHDKKRVLTLLILAMKEVSIITIHPSTLKKECWITSHKFDNLD